MLIICSLICLLAGWLSQLFAMVVSQTQQIYFSVRQKNKYCMELFKLLHFLNFFLDHRDRRSSMVNKDVGMSISQCLYGSPCFSLATYVSRVEQKLC